MTLLFLPYRFNERSDKTGSPLRRLTFGSIKLFADQTVPIGTILVGVVTVSPCILHASGATKDPQCAKSYRLVLRYLERCCLRAVRNAYSRGNNYCGPCSCRVEVW